ncbi:glutamate--tRNA ligase [Limobrevibacterium gyesilva]|uniref:Glutamate--tRNA ligase n=1 Tax=Limobrevibacterium gyesilva TaxID=2991712 RepID=A0AA41YV11_9PROT|nr:glutamate--tRNA ligase [Limobrevibacterium gyesilva]
MAVRFAPSPTGLLHVGNARQAVANWLFARKTGGRFILRLDDTDTARSTEENEEAIRQDMRWLGLHWDDSFRQTTRLARYAEVAEQLKQAGRLYPCFESEEELQAKRDQRIKRGQAPVYDRAMLKLTPEQRAAAEAGGKRPYWRFLLSNEEVSWNDLVLGRRRVKLPAVSDPVLIRADGTPLYTFTSVVDDLDTGISHVIRGEDHVTNTGVQIDLIKALGRNPGAIAFAHLPLLLDSDGGKLSKRFDGLSLRSLRQDGVEPMAITSYLARLGTSADPEPLPLEALAADFDFSRFSGSAARFDIRQLLALNSRVLHGLPFRDVADRLPPGATEAFWNAVRGNLDLLSEARGYWDVVAGTIVPPVIEGEGDYLHTALDLLPPEPWDDAVWSRWTEALKAATGRKGKPLFLPLRLALTGEDHGPDLKSLLPLIGRTRAALRLQTAAH